MIQPALLQFTLVFFKVHVITIFFSCELLADPKGLSTQFLMSIVNNGITLTCLDQLYEFEIHPLNLQKHVTTIS